MKRLLCFILTAMLGVGNVCADELEYTAMYVGSGKAYVNDVEMRIDPENEEVKVFVENNRSYLPIRFIGENYKGDVEWDEDTRTVNIAFEEREISLTIGIPEIRINGEVKALDVAPIIRNGRTFLPVRACVEAIGKEVFYSNGLIIISDIPDILHEIWDADIVDEFIETYFL